MKLPRHLACRVLVLGVGNRLFGDDGFGPRLMERMIEEGGFPEGGSPEDVCLLDAGTGAARLLFDLAISDKKRLSLLIIADAVRLDGMRPGEVRWLTPEELPFDKRDDFSLHQLPGSDLLADLSGGGCEVRILACQVRNIPAEIDEGLSPEVESALDGAARMLREFLKEI